MAVDFRTQAIDTNTSFAAPGGLVGTKLLLPLQCRVVEMSSEGAYLRVSLNADDAVVLTAANSNFYPASATWDMWPRGVVPGGEAESSFATGPEITVAREAAGLVSLVFRR